MKFKTLEEAIKILDRLVKKHPDFEKGRKKLEDLKAKAAAAASKTPAA
jgi:hypothetical protein